MNRTVNELILTAYKLCGEYSDNEIMEGYRIDEALRFLNQILDRYSRITAYLSYDTEFNFNLTIGKEEYEISRLTTADIVGNPIVSLKYVTLENDGVSFPIRILNDDAYYKRIRENTSFGFPTFVFLKNTVDKSIIHFYRAPSTAFNCNILAKTKLTNITINQSLTELPNSYDELIEYELAKKLCFVNKEPWTADLERALKAIRDQMLAANDIDLTLNLSSSLMPFRRLTGYNSSEIY